MNQFLEEISDGKKYGLQDMVKVACNDCKGCHSCCKDMGDTILLDPLDAYRLQVCFHTSIESLVGTRLELGVVDGLILPHIKMDEKTNCCGFLNEEGRCSIHTYRPGICRLFPLGRIYEEEELFYFLQKDGCVKSNRSKVKVAKWLDTEDLKKNQLFLKEWHSFRKKMEPMLREMKDEKMIKTITMFLLHTFFFLPYEETRDFYEQFYERKNRIESALEG